eukprot:TRINITY_DN849_c0_g2_i2.p1 TRINITY_DN849_c0_g2~~TRINITY_DN849_c0_g2_i2.p1  ORF type:complete len:774 (-),score=268.69 TRINITY_DN849_c0_g2_i2:1849-4074(-)
MNTIKNSTWPLLLHSSPEIRKLAVVVLAQIATTSSHQYNEVMSWCLKQLNILLSHAYNGILTDEQQQQIDGEGNGEHIIIQNNNTTDHNLFSLKKPTLDQLLLSFTACTNLLNTIISSGSSTTTTTGGGGSSGNVQNNNIVGATALPLNRIVNLLVKIFNVDGSFINPKGSTSSASDDTSSSSTAKVVHGGPYKRVELFQIIPHLHTSGYSILKNLLESLKTTLYTNINTVCDIVLHGYQSTSQPKRSCLPIRTMYIRCLLNDIACLCLKTFGPSLASNPINTGGSGRMYNGDSSTSNSSSSSSSSVVFVKPLVTYVIDELKSFKNQKSMNSIVKITEGRMTKRMKRRKSGGNNLVEQMTIAGQLDMESAASSTTAVQVDSLTEDDVEVQISLFKLIYSIFVNVGSFLDVETRTTLEKEVLHLSFNLYNIPLSKLSISSSHLDSENIPYPYRDYQYRKYIYKMLYAGILSPPPGGTVQPSTIPYALKLFQSGVNDPSPQVSKVCKEAFLLCSNILNTSSTPTAPLILPSNRVQRDNKLFINHHTHDKILDVNRGEEHVEAVVVGGEEPMVTSMTPLTTATTTTGDSVGTSSFSNNNPPHHHLPSSSLPRTDALPVVQQQKPLLTTPTTTHTTTSTTFSESTITPTLNQSKLPSSIIPPLSASPYLSTTTTLPSTTLPSTTTTTISASSFSSSKIEPTLSSKRSKDGVVALDDDDMDIPDIVNDAPDAVFEEVSDDNSDDML